MTISPTPRSTSAAAGARTQHRRRSRRRWPATILGVAGLLVVATPAGAAEPCPVTATPPVVTWQTIWQHQALTLCRGVDGSGAPAIDVQIVDFEAGGKMRVMSEPEPGQVLPAANTQYVRKTAVDWYNWVKGHVATPAPAQLFSVTNASFFKLQWYGWTMSFPQKKWNTLVSLGNDPECKRLNDGTSAKRYFGLSDPRAAGRQFPYIDTYGDACQSDQASVTRQLSVYRGQPVSLFDATVGYHPRWGDQDLARRTFVGTRSTDGLFNGTQDRAYVLTSVMDLTIAQAQDVLAKDFRTMYNIQLDGSGSTQYRTWSGWELTSNSTPDRPVPEILAIYDRP